MSAARAAVRKLFAAHLDGLVPAEENKRSLRFIVPGRQQQQLVGLLQQLEAAIGSSVQSPGSSSSSGAAAVQGLGEADVRAVSRYVADVQLSLTSLEEVFLSIVQQVRLHWVEGWVGGWVDVAPRTAVSCLFLSTAKQVRAHRVRRLCIKC
jgi:hypothetical protein